ncbi:Tm-1-like ATP-binding domain-containing protein [Paenibacillus macquariensis]|uniref:Uncharacterized protein, UPF0261 family n=1 Tax=Paenibacillus macquariensis TaxID=948756 RepID=A0ABY1KGF6_9BACL|nr:Tm-1-like ATP-binding domain-containing protein [Paenibacillus macquariensis]MEC0094164.1 Tm-1-like ATP-binding domain-containing protein [Paenibacillus macquariensis]OAB26966.1 hypothetical protein PMSM_25645 [Paenibacillus macquariensis subsp. macquariensis]SIR70187.1 Uncharacterized protein, UPF0261 family [Paenibacillus macquariensis]
MGNRIFQTKPTVVLLGTFDTKGTEYAYINELLQESGVHTILVDAGVLGESHISEDFSRHDVAEAAGSNISELIASGDRGASITTMAQGASVIAQQLYKEGRMNGIVGLGGSGGTALVTQVMRALPIGLPKLMVSTMASGETRPYVGSTDITMMYSVVDIAGINRLSTQILANAAGAISGMVKMEVPLLTSEKPLIGATMFGVTTPSVDVARERLEQLGYEVVVFHATGTGGASMESLIKDGFITATLDVTTTELADELVGGVLSAGPDRLRSAGEMGIPQVVSLGALDMVNFGPIDTVPQKFKDRLLYKHNETITLMRTTPDECSELGRNIALKLNASKGPITLFIPLKGFSLIAIEGQLFYDVEADHALIDALMEHLDQNVVEIIQVDTDINNPQFAEAMADRLHELYQTTFQQ